MNISHCAYPSVATLAASSMALVKTSGVYGLGLVTAGLGLSEDDTKSIAVQASDLEVVTVTDMSVTFTWATYVPGVKTTYGLAKPTVAAGQRMLMAPVGGGELKTVHEGFSESGYHHMAIEGLELDREYQFEYWSDDAKAEPIPAVTMSKTAPEHLGVLKTLPTLSGKLPATIALTNDTHIGKPSHDGIRFGNSGLSSEPGEQPFPSMQLESLLKTVKEGGIDTIVVNGDCTDSNRPKEYDKFLRVMNQFGEMDKQWFVARGNHDIHPPGLPDINGRRGRDIRKGKTYIPDYSSGLLVPTQQRWVTQVGKVRLIGLDTAELGYAGGRINRRQIRAARAELAQDPERPTILFAYHPITDDAVQSHLGGPSFMLGRTQAAVLQKILAVTPGAKAVFAGHTRRNRRGVVDVGAADFCERGSSLGYPGGYTRIHIHTGGSQVTYHRTRTPESLAWSVKTRQSLFELEPELMLGQISDRNYVQHCRTAVNA